MESSFSPTSYFENLMTLPNLQNAHIDIQGKLDGYALNPDHIVGRHKARVFQSALGLTRGDGAILADMIRNALPDSPAIKKGTNQYGDRYEVRFAISAFQGTVTIVSAWIILIGEDFPRLTSCYIDL
jgi:hypothetical protein